MLLVYRFLFQAFHYASSDIGQIDKICYNQRTRLFNCTIPDEATPTHHQQLTTKFPNPIDETRLIVSNKISESSIGEIYFGTYFIDNESKCVLIKLVKAKFMNTSR